MPEYKPLDKIKFCQELIESKEKDEVLKDLSILACENAKSELPESPTRERDTNELDSQIDRFKEEIDGIHKDIASIKKLVDQYETN